jgi:nitroreductase / dihydropteridine reductase
LNKILEITNLSATSYGLQPYTAVVISNEEIKEKLVEYSYNQTNVADSSHLIVFAARTDIDEDYIDNFVGLTAEARSTDIENLNGFRNMLIKSFSSKTDEALFNWASKQIYLALGTFLVACADEGIDSCPIGGFMPEAYDKVLNLKQYSLRSVVLAAIGYRHKDDKYQYFKKVRKPLNEMIIKID